MTALPISEDDIARLVKLFDEYGWDELHLEIDDARLTVARGAEGPKVELSSGEGRSERTVRESAPVAVETAVAETVAEETPALEPAGPLIRAPNLGTFWRQPKPGAPPYVEVGEVVDEDTTVCLIEVMKLFTPVKANMRGRVVEVLAKDGEMVEHDAPLFRLEPAP
jgi:acetyl-CoA carboxylase biotin carboxyl carrier protein